MPSEVHRKGDTPGDVTQKLVASGGSGTPGGSNTQVQYNNAGAFGGITGATTNGTALTLTAPVLGTPASGTLTNCTGLPVSTGVSGLAANVATFLATPSSANLAAAVTDETGSGAAVFANTPTLVTPEIGAATGTSLVLTQGTIGNAVLTLKSTATNDDPAETTYHARVTTTDATNTTIFTVAIPANTVVNIAAEIVGRRTGGIAGTADDGAFYMMTSTWNNIGGTATIIGAVTQIATHESQAAWGRNMSPSGGNVTIIVVGAANNDVTWHAKIRVQMVSS